MNEIKLNPIQSVYCWPAAGWGPKNVNTNVRHKNNKTHRIVLHCILNTSYQSCTHTLHAHTHTAHNVHILPEFGSFTKCMVIWIIIAITAGVSKLDYDFDCMKKKKLD